MKEKKGGVIPIVVQHTSLINKSNDNYFNLLNFKIP
jgi:hypothetical protein